MGAERFCEGGPQHSGIASLTMSTRSVVGRMAASALWRHAAWVLRQAEKTRRGRLVIVGVSREDGRVDLGLSLMSVILNPVVGMMKHPRRAKSMPAGMTAPTAIAAESFHEIRAVLREFLPGVRLRRGLFWRYRAVWRHPR